ncbi:MAG: hypothetical protein ACU826_02310 [Gammaproteobacteria bacterium]
MVSINVALVRLLQFVVFVMFTLMTLVYFGVLLLMPLDAVMLSVKLMSVIGLNDLIAALIAVPVIGFLVKMVYQTPGLCQMLMDIGLDIVNSGKLRVEGFNKIAESVKGA